MTDPYASYEADTAELTERVAVDLAFENAAPLAVRFTDLMHLWIADRERGLAYGRA